MKKSVLGKRPNFGRRQIRSPRGIRAGMTLVGKPDGNKIQVVGAPYQRNDGEWWVQVKIKYTKEGRWWDNEMSLADRNVVPYHTGIWNDRNWLERK